MFYIEGNIGAGKSTFITLFQKFLKNDEESHLLLEPQILGLIPRIQVGSIFSNIIMKIKRNMVLLFK